MLAKTSDKLKRAAIKGQIELIKEKLKNLKKDGGTDGTDYENDPEFQAAMEEFRRGLDEKQSQHRYNAENVTVESQLDRLRDGDDYVARVATRRDEPQAAEGAPESGKDYLAYITKPTGGVVIEGLDPHAKVYPTNYSNEIWLPEGLPDDIAERNKEKRFHKGEKGWKPTGDAWDYFRETLNAKQLANLSFALKQMNGGKLPTEAVFDEDTYQWYMADDVHNPQRVFVVAPHASSFFTIEWIEHNHSKEWMRGDWDAGSNHPILNKDGVNLPKLLDKEGTLSKWWKCKETTFEKDEKPKTETIISNSSLKLIGVYGKGHFDMYNNQDKLAVAYTNISDNYSWTLKVEGKAGLKVSADGKVELGVSVNNSVKKDNGDIQDSPRKTALGAKVGGGVNGGEIKGQIIVNLLSPDPTHPLDGNKKMMVSAAGEVKLIAGATYEASGEYNFTKGKAKGKLVVPGPLSIGASVGLEGFDFVDVDYVERRLPTNKKSN